jgi:hypothetical protein
MRRLVSPAVREQSKELLVRVLVAKDPRESTNIILQVLMGANAAPAAAVFSIDGEPKLFVGRGIAQGALEWTRDRWSREHNSLLSGRLSRGESCLLFPLMRQEELFGLLYLEAPQADLESIVEVSGLLTEAMMPGPGHTARQSVLENYLGQTPEDEIERRKLILLLDRHEWNVSRVARELGKTRSTVYHRLEALRIERRGVRRVVRMS